MGKMTALGLPRFLIVSLICLLLGACDLIGRRSLPPPGPKQPLVVGLPADPVFQQQAPNLEGMEGFSRDLASAFAKSLGVEVRFIVAPSPTALPDMLRDRQAHMVAALPVLKGEPDLIYSPALQETRQLIVQHEGALPVDEPGKLAGREIVLLPGAPQIHGLRSLALEPPPIVKERPGEHELQLLEGIASQRHDLVATDELHFDIAANFHPELAIAFALPGKIAYAWAFPASAVDLQARAATFIDAARRDGTLRSLHDRYYGHVKRLDTPDIQAFLGDVRTRLPTFRRLFQEAQEYSGIDWRLLAALAYQESKWDPLATSPTGVRGMMMLTEETADRLGVGNRLDARESVLAGADYFALLMDELSDEVDAPDRIWMALAAYNLGMGHLRAGRRLAANQKRNPDLWVDVKEVLPQLARPEVYQRLKSGRGRGGEAVILVENVRNYHDILARFEPAYVPPKPGKKLMPRKPLPGPRGLGGQTGMVGMSGMMSMSGMGGNGLPRDIGGLGGMSGMSGLNYRPAPHLPEAAAEPPESAGEVKPAPAAD